MLFVLPLCCSRSHQQLTLVASTARDMTSFLDYKVQTQEAPTLTVDHKGLLKIVHDEKKGRCLEATRDVPVGTLLYTEEPLVWAEYEEESEEAGEVRVNAELVVRAFGKRVFGRIDELEEEFAAFPRVESLDTSRSWFQLVSMWLLRDEGLGSLELSKRLRLALQLTPGPGLAECVDTVRQFRALHKNVLPKVLSDADGGFLLGVLNTNQVELEEVGGSGLFPTTALLEHSCAFNCSYTTSGTTLFLTATEPVKAGDRLSIDYMNGYYNPTAVRQEELFSTYGFVCDCRRCAEPDRTRAFRGRAGACRCGPEGIAAALYCPVGGVTVGVAAGEKMDDAEEDEEKEAGLVCLQCQALVSDAEYVKTCLAREKHYEQYFAEEAVVEADEAAVGAAVQEGVLHESHHIIFSATNELALAAAAQARRAPSSYPQAVALMRKSIALLNQVLPAVHHERVVLMDRLGQVAVCANEGELAKWAYTSAWNQSRLCSSASFPGTAKLSVLAANPPTSLEELLTHY